MDGRSTMTDIRPDRRVAPARPESQAGSERGFAVGDATAKNPLEGRSWPELRDEIYGEPERTLCYASRCSEKQPAP